MNLFLIVGPRLPKSKKKRVTLQNGVKQGIHFTVIPSNFQEDLPKTTSPYDYVLSTAKEKARQVWKEREDIDVLISADTVVVYKDKILEKPLSKEEAIDMLTQLSNQQHKVLTAVVIMTKTAEPVSFVEETIVKFGPLTQQQIIDYVETGEPFDKAGGYGYQGLGFLLVEEIHGCYYNVVGLPCFRLNEHLRQLFGFS